MTSQTNQQLYDERWRRFADNVALVETDRVPVNFGTRFWAARLAGISYQEVMYDVDKATASMAAAIRLVQPDGFSSAIYAFGKVMEAIGYRAMKWPGGGVVGDATFQYIDEQYMTAAEYDDYLFDPTGYFLKTYLPRIAAGFEGLNRFPDFAAYAEWRMVTELRAFADPELQQSLRRLVAAGEQLEATLKRIGDFVKEMAAEGYPFLSGGFCKSPYDHILDSMRGSKTGMLDMFRNKEKMLAAIDKTTPFLLRRVVEDAKALGNPYISMPMHWGLDGFMSPAQFKTFYWPSLRKIILHLIEQGMVPVVFWEGNCTSRLETIADIPRGKAIYWFEATDLVRAKEVLGDVVCLRGNVPASLLVTATPDDVDAYCRNLIRKVGKGGGFILDGAASIPDEARTENVLAMARSVTKYAR